MCNNSWNNFWNIEFKQFEQINQDPPKLVCFDMVSTSKDDQTFGDMISSVINKC